MGGGFSELSGNRGSWNLRRLLRTGAVQISLAFPAPRHRAVWYSQDSRRCSLFTFLCEPFSGLPPANVQQRLRCPIPAPVLPANSSSQSAHVAPLPCHSPLRISSPFPYEFGLGTLSGFEGTQFRLGNLHLPSFPEKSSAGIWAASCAPASLTAHLQLGCN